MNLGTTCRPQSWSSLSNTPVRERPARICAASESRSPSKVRCTTLRWATINTFFALRDFAERNSEGKIEVFFIYRAVRCDRFEQTTFFLRNRRSVQGIRISREFDKFLDLLRD